VPSPVEESYLEMIYNLVMEEGRVRPVDLAEKFKVSRPTATQTLQKLAADGLVTQDRAEGVRLTTEGERQTEDLLRRHRLAERLMFDVLGMDFITAHEQAHALEHWISPEVEERISSLLGRPTTCPHGNPIPGNAPSGIEYLRGQNAFRLSQAKPGVSVQVVSISEVVEDESALLDRLMNKQIVPGHEITIVAGGTGNGIRYVSRGSEHQIEHDLAEKIWVKDAGAGSRKEARGAA
jgi:DtxR family Mn-dependent transcriptional regulator